MVNPENAGGCEETQNIGKGQDDYLLRAVRKIQRKGLSITASFILGTDGEDEGVFDAQLEFIREAGIPAAIVGLLTALRGTDLYERLHREDRLLAAETNGGGGGVALNFRPEMDPETLLQGYRRVLHTLYDPALENYYERCLTMLKHVRPNPYVGRSTHFAGPVNEGWLVLLPMIARILQRLAFSKKGPAFVKFLASVFRQDPRLLPEAIILAAMGYHFQKVTSQFFAVHDFNEFVKAELAAFEGAVSHQGDGDAGPVRNRVHELHSRIQERYEAIHHDFRCEVEDTLQSFRAAVVAHPGGGLRTAPAFAEPREASAAGDSRTP